MGGTFGEALREAAGDVVYDRLSAEARERLARLDSLVREFEGAVGLTGFEDSDTRLRRFFAEPLKAARFLPATGRAWDLGSGGGAPGLPLAVASPGLEWTLVESSLRKALFLEEAASELGLRNVRVLRARWQNVIPAWAELVTLRGLRIDETERDRILESLSPGGRLLWFSGRERLLEQGRLLRERPGLRIRGPVRLLPKGGFLLLAERRQARDGP